MWITEISHDIDLNVIRELSYSLLSCRVRISSRSLEETAYKLSV
jgi:hypothetical protein